MVWKKKKCFIVYAWYYENENLPDGAEEKICFLLQKNIIHR